MSLAALPTYSHNNTVVTINLGDYNWSDGKPVTTRDVAFWINLLRVNKGSFAAYIPGEFPDSLKSYKIVDAKTIVLTLNQSYNPTWFTYDQLSQITPLPTQAWDKTSASGKVGNYDQTTSGAKAVFNFLTAQSKDIATYSTNPLWKIGRRPVEDGQLPVQRLRQVPGQPELRRPGQAEAEVLRRAAVHHRHRRAERAAVGQHASTTATCPPQEASQSGQLAIAGLHHGAVAGLGHDVLPDELDQNPEDRPAGAPALHPPGHAVADRREGVRRRARSRATATSTTARSPPSRPTPTATPTRPRARGRTTPRRPSACCPATAGRSSRTGPAPAPRRAPAPGQCGKGIAAGRRSWPSPSSSAAARWSPARRCRRSSRTFSQAGHQPQPERGPVRRDHQPAHPVQVDPVVLLVADAELRRRLDLRRGPVPDRRPAVRHRLGLQRRATTPTRRPTRSSPQTIHGPGSLTAYEDYMAQQMPVLWMPQPVNQISEISTQAPRRPAAEPDRQPDAGELVLHRVQPRP